jgi:putative flippase GtrA
VHHLNVRRWGVFNLVGFGGFLVQIATIALLTRAAGFSSIAATVIALELAALQNYFAHSRWTWPERPAVSVRAWLSRYWRYQITKTGSLAVNVAVTGVLIHAGLLPEIANTAAVLVCALPNYLISERYVFRYTPAHADTP